MREIKFRAWETKHFEFLDQDDLTMTLDGVLLIDWDGRILKSDEVIVEQYTGLKDANGVEIYEGDIVKVVSQYWGQLGNTYEVKFESGSFLVPTATLYDIKGSIVVIGNIHENADLLEE